MRKLACLLPVAALGAAMIAVAAGGAGAAGKPQPAGLIVHDLSDPEFSPPQTPEWMKEDLPEWVRPLVGKNGLLHPWRDLPGPMGRSTVGLDRYQANHWIFYRPATAKFLYEEYTPLTVDYKPGTLPTYEKVAAEYTKDCETDTEKAVALVTKCLREVCPHPTVPPRGPKVRADRGLDDESLLQSGKAWCNEQARVYVRLCQVLGIPARIVQMLHSDNRSGHTLAEFHADGRWALADVSYYIVVPGPDGQLQSARECFDRREGTRHAGIAYKQRYEAIAAMSDEELNVGDHEAAEKLRAEYRAKTAEELGDFMFGSFGLVNYPLPR